MSNNVDLPGNRARGAGKADNTHVNCNLVRDVPKRVDDGPGVIFESGSHWSAPTYTCASAVKATINTVTFFQTAAPIISTSWSFKRLMTKNTLSRRICPSEASRIGFSRWTNLNLFGDWSMTPTKAFTKYRYAFGIPAFLVMPCLLVIAVIIIGIVISGQSSIGRVDQRLWQTTSAAS